MQVNRRSFLTYGSALAVAGSALMTTGCWFTASVFSSIMSYVGVGLQAFSAVVALLTGTGVINPLEGTAIQAIINLIKAGFADLQTAVQNYNNAPAADKQTLLGKISVALADLEGSIQNFWNDLNIPNQQLASIIEGLLGIILSTLSGFGSQLPVPTVAAKKRVFAKMIVVPAKKRNPKQFKTDFNATLAKGGYSQYQVN